MLDIGGDQVAALLPEADGHTLDGMVVGLGAAGGEDHFLGVGVDQRRYLCAGLFQRRGGRLPHLIVRGRVAEHGLQVPEHRLFDLGMEGRRGQIVQVDQGHDFKKPPLPAAG